MTKPLIIFDFDGVLVNTEEVYSANLNHMVNSIGYKQDINHTRERFAGVGIYDILKELEVHHSIKVPNPDEIVAELRANNAKSAHLIQPANGAPEVIKQLIQENIEYCIASSSPKMAVIKLLKSSGMYNMFEENKIFSGEDLGKYKPDPLVYLTAINAMNRQASNCIAIEDSYVGVKAAINANLRVIGYTGCYQEKKILSAKLSDAGAIKVFDDFLNAIDFAKNMLLNH